MPHIARNGVIIGGVAGAGVFSRIGDGPTTRIIPAPSGTSNTMGDRVIGFHGLDAAMQVVSCAQDGSDRQVLTTADVNYLVGGDGTWAYSILGAVTFTQTSWGLRLPNAAAMQMLDDGSLIVQTSYPTDRGVACYLNGAMTPAWEVPGADISFRYPYPQLYAVDAYRVVWCNAAGFFQTYGLPQPAGAGVPLVNPFVVTHPDGSLWLGYTAV